MGRGSVIPGLEYGDDIVRPNLGVPRHQDAALFFEVSRYLRVSHRFRGIRQVREHDVYWHLPPLRKVVRAFPAPPDDNPSRFSESVFPYSLAILMSSSNNLCASLRVSPTVGTPPATR